MQSVKRIIWESKNYILFGVLLFFCGTWLGYVFSPLFAGIIHEMMAQFEGIQEELAGKSDGYIAWFIFQNNAKAALSMVSIGIVLFFAPVFILFANGLALGYVLYVSAMHQFSPKEMLLYGILPHGVLELPAIFLAGGVGLFLGLRLLRFLFGRGQLLAHIFSSKRDLGAFLQEQGWPVLQRRAKDVLALLILIVLMLVVAAAIEGFITPMIIEQKIGNLKL